MSIISFRKNPDVITIRFEVIPHKNILNEGEAIKGIGSLQELNINLSEKSPSKFTMKLSQYYLNFQLVPQLS